MQLDLLSDSPIARRVDPPTSKLAAARVTESGDRAIQQEMVLRMVEASPGLTSAELAAKYNQPRHMVARRLPELRAREFLKENRPKEGAPGMTRTCTVTGASSLTWWPTTKRRMP